MKKRIIYREPLGKQERFYISTIYKRTKNVRRSLELCKDMYLNMVNFENVSKKEAQVLAISCEEVALDGAFIDEELVNKYDFAVKKEAVAESSKWQTVSVWDGELSPEKLRMKVFCAILQGAVGIEYNSVYGGGITRESKQGSLYRYIQDMNYRITQIGRTLIALKKVEIKSISDSMLLAEQELPEGCVVGEFVDTQGNHYLMIQNQDCNEKKKKEFKLKLQRKFRVYRVNPHDGNQVLTKECTDNLKILIMPGDAELLRFQDVEEEAYLIDYALRK